ncbi:hypothetical protein [uncultured Methanolobus sp.]|uniref:hypothetical protein n=1 Tax=uncultured Methanolobus sp. TaxID=218300 RepID=UPI002AAA6A97|nr:hypothetical protein [uncultured Methanolobus sp.]
MDESPKQLISETRNRIPASFGKPGEEIIESINNVRKDVWKLRLSKNTTVHSLGVEQFETVVTNIRKIISYTASAEQDARPYYASPLSTGSDYSKKCRFGQTFRGSYGITIEVPIDETLSPDGTLPLGRRISERIIKSLKLVEKEVEFGDVEPIYKDSINGNLCSLLIELLKVSEGDIEYSANLSPLYEPSDEIKDISTVNIKHANIAYLKEVYDRMHKDTELIPDVTIQGVITELKHEFQESNEDSDYNIIISGTHDGSNDHDYHVTLKKDDYIKACHIHTTSIEKKKEPVEITGNIRRTRKRWYIDSYTTFIEIGDIRAHNAKKDELQSELGNYSSDM